METSIYAFSRAIRTSGDLSAKATDFYLGFWVTLQP